MSDEYAIRMNAFHDAHGGAVQACIVRRQHLPLMVRAAAAGDVDNLAVLRGLEAWMREAGGRKKRDRFLCLDCSASFHQHRMPDAFLVVIPFAATGCAMVTGICRRCAARDDAALSTAALDNLRVLYPHAALAEPGQA